MLIVCLSHSLTKTRLNSPTIKIYQCVFNKINWTHNLTAQILPLIFISCIFFFISQYTWISHNDRNFFFEMSIYRYRRALGGALFGGWGIRWSWCSNGGIFFLSQSKIISSDNIGVAYNATIKYRWRNMEKCLLSKILVLQFAFGYAMSQFILFPRYPPNSPLCWMLQEAFNPLYFHINDGLKSDLRRSSS